MECSQKFPGIEEKPFFDTVIGALGDVKVCTERKNGGELSGESGIKEGNEESEGVGRIRDDDRQEQGMGRVAGRAQDGADPDQLVTYKSVMITDEMAFIGAVPAECGGRGMAGRASGDHGRVKVFQKGADGMFIKVLDLMVGPADIKEKSYHSIVFSGRGTEPFHDPVGICIMEGVQR